MGADKSAPPKRRSKSQLAPLNPFIYDSVLWIFSIIVDLFFREVHPRSSWRIPRKGPVIFVAAPHANQFVDPLILARTIRREAKRRIAFLIAAKSMDRQFIGSAARIMGAVPVGRAMDAVHSAKGKVYLPDPVNDPLLLRGVDTEFENGKIQVGGMVVLPKVEGIAATAQVAEVKSNEEIRLKKPFSGKVAMKQLTGREDPSQSSADGQKGGYGGTTFKVAPHIDQNEVYDTVFEKLHGGGCVGIYPEGGSHDRTTLLELKAGIAIMYLGAKERYPDSKVTIIPCGMNYFHAHKFRSRAVIEFGSPVEIPDEWVDMYKRGGSDKRTAIGHTLDKVLAGLQQVTVTTPSYETLMTIQAVRRLYNPKGSKLPLGMVVELNRRLALGYDKYKDNPRVLSLRNAVMKYDKDLRALNIRDHQVEYGKLPVYKIIWLLFERTTKLAILSIAVIPGVILFAPIFIVGKLISIRKAKEALAASNVKVKARDVIATWKLLVALALPPTLYTIYVIILTFWTWENRIGGRVPESLPLFYMPLIGYIVLPAITYGSLRFGEIGMDIFKSLRPLLVALNPSSGNTLVKLRQRRAALAAEVTELVNTLGPEMFPDFDNARIVADPFREGQVAPSGDASRRHHRRASEREPDSFDSIPPTPANGDGESGGASRGGPPLSLQLSPSQPDLTRHRHNLPKNESYSNLASIGLFSSRPGTPTTSSGSRRSRSRTSSGGGFAVQGFTALDADAGGEHVPLNEVNRRIRGAMEERSKRRKSLSEGSWSGASTPATEPSTPVTEGFGRKNQ